MLTKYAQEKTFAALYIKKMHKFTLKRKKNILDIKSSNKWKQ